MRLHPVGERAPPFPDDLAAIVLCPLCREHMVAPELTEFVDSSEIRHHWVCDACGHEFCTALSVA